jgi:uncharacterized protein YhbP (UPF0306 family)
LPVTLHARGYESERLNASVARILTANTLCSMATRNNAGTLHINFVYYCFNSDLVLYFLSRPDSHHGHNLARVPQMAVGVFDTHQPWGDPHTGLQLLGSAALASQEAARKAGELYAARFPRSGEVLPRAGEEQPQSLKHTGLQLYGFSAERVQILDEWEFGEGVFISATILR